MNRNEEIKTTVLQAIKELHKAQPGWVYTKTGLHTEVKARLKKVVERNEVAEALQELKKEKRIYSVKAYNK